MLLLLQCLFREANFVTFSKHPFLFDCFRGFKLSVSPKLTRSTHLYLHRLILYAIM